MNDPFARLASIMVRRRWLVLGIWIVLLVGLGGAVGPHAADVVKGGGFVVAGSDSAQVYSILDKEFHSSTLTTAIVVYHSHSLKVDDPAFTRAVVNSVDRIRQVSGVRSVTMYYDTGFTQLVSKDRHTTFALVPLKGGDNGAPKVVPHIRSALNGLTIEHYVTGRPGIDEDTYTIGVDDLKKTELLTGPVVLILLLLVFRTLVSALIPLILGAFSVAIASAGIYFVGSSIDTSILSQNVGSLIGLGLAIDYAMIVISRYREERAAGHPVPVAIERTMSTAGRSIIYSGITVILAMLIMTVILWKLMIVRSISIGVILVAVTALCAGATLLPAILALLGDRIEWVRVLPKRKPRGDRPGIWYRLSNAIMHRPWTWLGVSLIILMIMASPFLGVRMVGATTGVMPSKTESVVGADIMNREFGAPSLTPIQIIIHAKHKNGIWNQKFLATLEKVTKILLLDPRTKTVASLRTLVPHINYPFQNITPHYFTPIPRGAVEQFIQNPGRIPNIPLSTYNTVMNVPVNNIPTAPSFFGFGRFTVPAGGGFPSRSVPSFNVLRLESGSLRVVAGSGVEIAVGRHGQVSPAVQPAPVGRPFTLLPSDQLVVPVNATISLRNSGKGKARFIDAVLFVIRSSANAQNNWTEGVPNPDLFQGIPRQVMSGGVALRLPTGKAIMYADRLVAQPGAFFPKHTHPGPELIAVRKGTFTVFATPPTQMTMMSPTGQTMEGPFDTPIHLPAGGKALVQMGITHRGRNLGNVPTVFYSTRVYAADQVPFVEIAPTEAAVQFINLHGNNDTALINVIPRSDEYSSEHENYVYDLRNRIIPEIHELAPYTVLVGGESAAFLDFRDTLYGRFPYMVVAVMLMVFFILMMFFQSVYLPIKAMFMNLASILATFGILTIIFQHGVGTGLLGFKSMGLLNVFTPATLYVILFALSTDYEVFMLSRVKEYYHETGDDRYAVSAGLQHTAGVITAAALILIGTFGSFAAGSIVTVKEIGIGLAVGVLLDATLVRLIMVPATMRLLGRRNWWMPEGLKRFVPELREGPPPTAVSPPLPAGE